MRRKAEAHKPHWTCDRHKPSSRPLRLPGNEVVGGHNGTSRQGGGVSERQGCESLPHLPGRGRAPGEGRGHLSPSKGAGGTDASPSLRVEEGMERHGSAQSRCEQGHQSRGSHKSIRELPGDKDEDGADTWAHTLRSVWRGTHAAIGFGGEEVTNTGHTQGARVREPSTASWPR